MVVDFVVINASRAAGWLGYLLGTDRCLVICIFMVKASVFDIFVWLNATLRSFTSGEDVVKFYGVSNRVPGQTLIVSMGWSFAWFDVLGRPVITGR